jgi:hypothetical protein
VLVGIGVFLATVVGLIAYGRREASRYIARVMETRGIGPDPGRRSGG